MQVYCDILQALESGESKPSHILKKANITWVTVIQYLLSLEEKKLVTKLTGLPTAEYRITAKGRHLLNQYLEIQAELKINSENFL